MLLSHSTYTNIHVCIYIMYIYIHYIYYIYILYNIYLNILYTLCTYMYNYSRYILYRVGSIRFSSRVRHVDCINQLLLIRVRIQIEMYPCCFIERQKPNLKQTQDILREDLQNDSTGYLRIDIIVKIKVIRYSTRNKICNN